MEIEFLKQIDYWEQGKYRIVRYAFSDSPFGPVLLCIVGGSVGGLCFIEHTKRDALKEMQKHWSLSTFREQPSVVQPFAETIFSGNWNDLSVCLIGTPFQLSVWQALLTIPYGHTCSYEDISRQLGLFQAKRAVACAIAKNPVSFLVPCHRVIFKSGEIGNYRWGASTKRNLLKAEWSLYRLQKNEGEMKLAQAV